MFFVSEKILFPDKRKINSNLPILTLISHTFMGIWLRYWSIPPSCKQVSMILLP